jgi:hypothetical protein
MKNITHDLAALYAAATSKGVEHRVSLDGDFRAQVAELLGWHYVNSSHGGRVDVGAELVTRDTCRALNGENTLGRDLPALGDPVGNSGLTDAEAARQTDLPAGGFNGLP